MIQKRLERFIKALPENVDAALLTADHSRQYLSGFDASDDMLFITKEKGYFLADFRYIEAVKKNVKHMEAIMPEKGMIATVNELIEKHGVKTVAFEDREVTVANYELYKKHINAELVPMGQLVEVLRYTKDAAELESIKKAQAITDKTFEHLVNFIKPGMTEREVMIELQLTQARLGSEKDSFDPIVVSGKNSSLPHGVPTDKKIEYGDFVTLDFGAVIDGYHSDMTRTVAIGEPTEEMVKVYNTVLKAQLNALENVKVGLTGKECDAFARSVIEEAGYGKNFGHSLGHSVGLLIHELPGFSPKSKAIIEAGNVVTVEPGIYLEDKFGVRIEDMVYMTENGPINLTNSPKELIIIK